MALAGGGVTFSRAGSSLAYRDLVVSDARGRRLPARFGVVRGQVLLHADVRGAQFPVTVDPLFQQLAKLTASNGQAGDELGGSVSIFGVGSLAISGNTVVAGAPNASAGQGAVYVFTKPASGWANQTQAAELTASDGAAGDNLGGQVAIDGSTIVAGAPGATVSGHAGQGALYVFTEPGGGWASAPQPEHEAAKLTASDGAAGDQLGWSVAISGSTIAGGADNASIGTHAGQGAAYVFTQPGGGWSAATQAAKLTASDGNAGDNLGWSVAVGGGAVVAGAPQRNSSQGAAYVFTQPGGGWSDETQAAVLTASVPAAPDRLGYSVAADGGTVVAGAPTETVGTNIAQGAAYVFTEPGGGWSDETQAAKLTASDGAALDVLGWSVAVSGSTVVAGAPGAAPAGNMKQGAAYVFAKPGGGWSSETQAAKLTALDGAGADDLGYSVAVVGSTIAADAPGAAIGSHHLSGSCVSGPQTTCLQGAAYVFGPAAPRRHRRHGPSLALAGLFSPRPGSRWPPGSTVTVTTAVRFVGGPRVPGSLAAELAADCYLTVRATGAQTLSTHCMSYDRASQQFTYRWRLRAQGTGTITIDAQLSWPSISGESERIAIARSRAGPPCRGGSCGP